MCIASFCLVIDRLIAYFLCLKLCSPFSVFLAIDNLEELLNSDVSGFVGGVCCCCVLSASSNHFACWCDILWEGASRSLATDTLHTCRTLGYITIEESTNSYTSSHYAWRSVGKASRYCHISIWCCDRNMKYYWKDEWRMLRVSIFCPRKQVKCIKRHSLITNLAFHIDMSYPTCWYWRVFGLPEPASGFTFKAMQGNSYGRKPRGMLQSVANVINIPNNLEHATGCTTHIVSSIRDLEACEKYCTAQELLHD